MGRVEAGQVARRGLDRVEARYTPSSSSITATAADQAARFGRRSRKSYRFRFLGPCRRGRGKDVVDDPVGLGMHNGAVSRRASTGMRIAHLCDSHQDRPDGVATAVATTVSLLGGAGHEVQLYQPAPLLVAVASRTGCVRCRCHCAASASRAALCHSAAGPGHRPHPHGRAHRDRPDDISAAHGVPVVMTLAHRPTCLLRLLPRDTDRRRARRGASPARLDGPRLPTPGPARPGRRHELFGSVTRSWTASRSFSRLRIRPRRVAEFTRAHLMDVPTSLALADDPLGRAEIRRLLGIPPAAPVVLAVGPTHAGEESVAATGVVPPAVGGSPRPSGDAGVRQRRRPAAPGPRGRVAHALRILPVPHARMAGIYRSPTARVSVHYRHPRPGASGSGHVGLPVVLADPALATRPGASLERRPGRPAQHTIAGGTARRRPLPGACSDPRLHQRLAEAGRVAAAPYPTSRYLDHLLAAYSFAAESAPGPPSWVRERTDR